MFLNSLAWPDRFLGAGRYRLQYKRPHFLGAGAYTASDNTLRLKSSLATRDWFLNTFCGTEIIMVHDKQMPLKYEAWRDIDENRARYVKVINKIVLFKMQLAQRLDDVTASTCSSY